MTGEEFITLETAKLAKQAGFDWKVNSYLSYYGNCPDNPHWAVSVQQEYKDWNNYKFKHILEAYSAPTQSVLQRWLREVKGYHIYISHTYTVIDGQVKSAWEILYEKMAFLKPNSILILEDNLGRSLTFDTYEAALEAGLQKCLTILIDNNDTKRRNFTARHRMWLH